MKILVIGGMHGNEPLGPAIVRLFEERPVENISAVLANKQAIKAASRFVKSDLNRSFPGDSTSNDYEIRRAAELLEMCKSFDVVLDFHNTHSTNNDCTFVGESAKLDLYDISEFLGLSRVVVADYDCINKYATNCISIEISLDSELMNAELWHERIITLVNQTGIPTAKDIERYKFVYRITLEDRDRLRLQERQLISFTEMPQKIASALGVVSPAYPIFIADPYTPYNYGGVLNRIVTQKQLTK